MLKLILGIVGLRLVSNNSLVLLFSTRVLIMGLIYLYAGGGVILVTERIELDKLGLVLVFLCLWVFVIMVLVRGDVKAGNKSYGVYYSLILFLTIVLVMTFRVSDYI